MKHSTFSVTGFKVAVVSPLVLVEKLKGILSGSEKSRAVYFLNTHSIAEACTHPELYGAIFKEADLNVPDGMPLVWLAYWQGFKEVQRCSGPDIFQLFFKETFGSYRHFFYGASEGVMEKMLSNLRQEYPLIQIAGYHCPPFRELTDAERQTEFDKINAAKADIVWVALGCPKQELWIHHYKNKIDAKIIAGVGQCFNVVAGQTRRAPEWMRSAGLEWLFRLSREPGRLTSRYLFCGPVFFWNVFLQITGFKKFD